jgi:HD-like signal output (HDOD) protein
MDNHPEVVQKLLSAIENHELKLPTQPEVAVRIRDCAEDPNLNSEKLAKVISLDPGLTARFLQIANSPLTRGSVEITSLTNVISRLGLRFVSNIATGMAMEQIFQSTNENVDQLMYATWRSSTHLAAVAHVLAINFSKVSADMASLAGMMHQIGILPILAYAENDDILSNNKELLIEVIKNHHGKIGQAILESWQFPTEIATLPGQIYQAYEDNQNSPTLVHVIQAALLKNQEMNKNFLSYDEINPSIYARLKLPNEEPLIEAKITHQLEEAVKIYCSL